MERLGAVAVAGASEIALEIFITCALGLAGVFAGLVTVICVRR